MSGDEMVQIHPVPEYDPGVLRIFVVHEHPLDFPGAWPVRMVSLNPGRTDHDFVGVLVGTPGTLEEARALIPPWADTCLPRQGDDLPTIRETWL